MSKLVDKVAIVSGSGRRMGLGMGREIALEPASEGAAVVITGQVLICGGGRP